MLAIEIGPATAAKLRSNLPSERLRVAVGDFEVMEIAAGEADAVFCRDLLEFLGDFKSAAPKKSSTVRKLAQAAAQNEPVARYLAPHQDLLFDFLRAYEAAPKMRPPSGRRAASGAPVPAGRSSPLSAAYSGYQLTTTASGTSQPTTANRA